MSAVTVVEEITNVSINEEAVSVSVGEETVVIVSEGVQGPPGPVLNAIGGFPLAIERTSVQSGDLIMFDGESWTNESKTNISDGGNF